MNQSESIAKLATALSKAQSEFNGVEKTSNNPFFKSKYADLYGCIEATKDILASHGLCVIQTMEPAEKGTNIITTLAHSSGEWIRGTINMNPKKDDDQSRGSSITYGRRYSYAAIIGLAQRDDDANASNGNVPKEPQKKKPAPKDDKSNAQYWINLFRKNVQVLDQVEPWKDTYREGVKKMQGGEIKKLMNVIDGFVKKETEKVIND